jgi:hypothetical protein
MLKSRQLSRVPQPKKKSSVKPISRPFNPRLTSVRHQASKPTHQEFTPPQSTESVPIVPNPTRKNIHSIYDLSFQQIKDVLNQSHLLSFKVNPLRATTQQSRPQVSQYRTGAQTSSTFDGLKPLKDSKILLLHSFSTKKSKHEEFLKSNVVQVPAILGSTEVDVTEVGLVDIEEIQNRCQKEFVKLYGIVLKSDDKKKKKSQSSGSSSSSSSSGGGSNSGDNDIKPKRSKKTKSSPLSIALNDDTIYNDDFLSQLTPEQQELYKKYQQKALITAFQTKNVTNTPTNNPSPSQPYDLILSISTLKRQTYLPTLIKQIHQPTGDVIQDDNIYKDMNTDGIDTNNSPPSSSSPPSIILQDEQTSLLSLLSIFSLLPRETLLNNPNSLKIAYIGYDYSENNFVPELVYLCRRFGVNLSLSTPNSSIQFSEMKMFEQSCIAAGKPIPIAKKKKRNDNNNNNTNNNNKNDGDNDDTDSKDIAEDLYDDMELLEPILFTNDQTPGLSPHITNHQVIKNYSKYAKYLQDVQKNNPNFGGQNDTQQSPQQDTISNDNAPESFEDAAVLSQNNSIGNNTTTPTPALTLKMMKKNNANNNTNKKTTLSNPTTFPSTLTSSNIQIHPAIIEYSHHPFISVQHADFIITNSIFPATTHSYLEHPSFELDKEMASFAKDTAKIFHVTEGISNWNAPPLGVHDPRCMLEQQIQKENYVLAALSLVLMDKQIH